MKYCANCGAELKDNAKFCANCGEKCEKDTRITQVTKESALKRGKVLRGIIIALFFITGALVGVRHIIQIQQLPSKKDIQIATNNMQNCAELASDGKWLYYNNSGLWKMRMEDEAKKTLISNDAYAEQMFCIGGKLYYYSKLRYHVFDGVDDKELDFCHFGKGCLQTDGKKIYASDEFSFEDGGVYLIKDDKVEKKIANIHPTRLLLQGDYLYVVSRYNSINNIPNEYYGTWRLTKDGSEMVQVFDYCPSYLIFDDDKIYFTDKNWTICSAELDGSNITVYEERRTDAGLNVTEDYIVYVDYETNTLHRMNKDGSYIVELNHDESEGVNIIDEWIYYENWDDDHSIYKMKLDGTLNEPIY